MILLLFACSKPVEKNDTASPTCLEEPVLFGTPSEATGLDSSECRPACSTCGDGPWLQPTYTAADFADWQAWILTNPPVPLSADPYLSPAPAAPDPNAVCAVLLSSDGSYQLKNYDSPAKAHADGAEVTHFGVCGNCSSLADLVVYASTPDLTAPVRDCGMANLSGTVEDLTACIQAIGFTPVCASIWAYNTLHTRDACLNECMAALNEPYNEPDGSLNPCLQCDEDQSGAVFKAIAGRTRRNTGLASSICRPCSEVRPLEHRYGAP